MTETLMTVETYLAQFPSILSIVTALGTWAAVLCALYIARKTNKPHIEFSAGGAMDLVQDPRLLSNEERASRPQFVSATLRNFGPVSVYFNFFAFSWRIPGVASFYLHAPINDGREWPIRLDPGQTETILLVGHLPTVSEALNGLIATEPPLPFRAAPDKRSAQLRVGTTGGEWFTAKLDDDLKDKVLGPRLTWRSFFGGQQS